MTYSEAQKQAVWEKATPVEGFNPADWRKDDCGAWIFRSHYGRMDTDYGWQIDHIIPENKGGETILSNLRPLQWLNNESRQDGKLVCKVTSVGNRNVELL